MVSNCLEAAEHPSVSTEPEYNFRQLSSGLRVIRQESYIASA